MSENLENLNVDPVENANATESLNSDTSKSVENCEVNENDNIQISDNDTVGSDIESDNVDCESVAGTNIDDTKSAEVENIISLLSEIASKKQELENELIDKKEYLNSNLMKYDSENYFQNESFKNLYKEAFNALGTKLDTDKFVKLVDDYVESRIEASNRKQIANKENDDLTDSMNFSGGETKKQERVLRMQDIPDDELEKYIAKYV